MIPVLREFTDSYVDDSAVFSEEWYNHLAHLETFSKHYEKRRLNIEFK